MLYAVLALYVLYLILIPCRRHIHMLQQLQYRPLRYVTWYGGNLGQVLRLLLPAGRAKLPLKYTPRVKRLLALTSLLVIGYALLAGIAVQSRLWSVILLLAGFLFAADIAFIANLLLLPLEKLIAGRYINQARARLAAQPGLLRIGITGSYGKTSVKLIAAQLLAEKYRLLATPGSYNTPLGITRIIREQLNPVHELFLAEMGARQAGDIAELCALVRPDIGLLTAIGEQHLQTFGSIERVAAAKWELIDALPAGGLAIVNGDDARIRSRLHLATCPLLTYGLNAGNDFRADDIAYLPRGMAFTAHHGGQAARFETALLGLHNVRNILAALALCQHLGLPMHQLRRAVKRLAPAEHRLQLRDAGLYTVIDDAYNANAEGAAMAIQVLLALPGKQKIVITPGLVELGEREYELNFELGRQLAAADRVILVGVKRSRALEQGLLAAGFDPQRLQVAVDLEQARQYLAAIAGAGDVVLYENDLPDVYHA